MGLEETLGSELIARRLTLGVAESCTGGLLGYRLTTVAGSSAYFLGGVIAYANEVKQRVLGVDAGLLAREGAVSEPVAEAMAKGVRQVLGADLGVGVTGIAGPGGGTALKPVGRIYIAVSSANISCVRKFDLAGERDSIRQNGARAALELLEEFLNAHPTVARRSA